MPRFRIPRNRARAYCFGMQNSTPMPPQLLYARSNSEIALIRGLTEINVCTLLVVILSASNEVKPFCALSVEQLRFPYQGSLIYAITVSILQSLRLAIRLGCTDHCCMIRFYIKGPRRTGKFFSRQMASLSF